MSSEQQAADDYVVIGRISGLFGVRGWLKLFSHTEPRDNILNYSPWFLEQAGEWRPYELSDGRPQGRGVVAHLAGCDDREQAAALVGCNIAIRREQLPPAEEGEYYWGDLTGLAVFTRDGQLLGRVDHLFETGANDVIVVKGERERLIPFIADVVLEVDLSGHRMTVDWDPEF